MTSFDESQEEARQNRLCWTLGYGELELESLFRVSGEGNLCERNRYGPE